MICSKFEVAGKQRDSEKTDVEEGVGREEGGSYTEFSLQKQI